MKAYSGMWIAYKQLKVSIQTAYKPMLFSESCDNAAIGFLINDALSVCPKDDGWFNHNANFVEVKQDDLVRVLDSIKGD